MYGFMRSAQHKNGDEQIEVDGQRGLRIESRVLVNTTKDNEWKENEVGPTTMTARHLASCRALADAQESWCFCAVSVR